tara:strand:+ start:1163 stop:1387 length:225 start_codon:yes stop_codon:yes gene_type:complete
MNKLEMSKKIIKEQSKLITSLNESIKNLKDIIEIKEKQLNLSGVVKSFICHDADTYGKGAKCSEMCVDCRNFNK